MKTRLTACEKVDRKKNENAPEGASENTNVRLRMKDENTPCGV